MPGLVRALLCLTLVALYGVAPAFAWSQGADPCFGAPDEIHDVADADCLAACQCPCCPARLHFAPVAITPQVPDAAPPGSFAEPATPLRTGVKARIFHPPSA